MEANEMMLFWTAFGAIGTTLGAFATAIAVVVALWQTKHAEKKKLKLGFSDDMKMITEGCSEPEETVIRLCVINNGNRDVVIDMWGFCCHENGSLMLLGFNQSRLMRNLNPTLPCELKKEQKIDLLFERASFIKELKEGEKEGKFKRYRKIKFFVLDTTGKSYYVRSKKTVGEILKGVE